LHNSFSCLISRQVEILNFCILNDGSWWGSASRESLVFGLFTALSANKVGWIPEP